MMQLSELVQNQSKKIIDNKKHAITVAALLSIIPFASWLSIAVVIFVTLRKGGKLGFEVLLPAMVIHSIPLMMLVPIESALVNTLIAYIPCYLASLSLRQSANWQQVSMVFFVQALTAFALIHWLLPDFAMAQLIHFKKMISQYDEYQHLFEQSMQGVNDYDLAQLFLGIQILSIVASSVISLLCARMMQSQLYVPGGFKAELVSFRASKVAFLTLIAVSVGAYCNFALAVSLVPMLIGYFLLAGINLSYSVLGRKWNSKTAVLLVILSVLKPTLLLFLLIIFGVLDSLFNFRLYLPGTARESI